jgi:hypothetical protein
MIGMVANYKPGSGIHRMWTAYEKDGPDAARKIGLELHLSPSTINTRVRGWDRDKGAPKSKALPKHQTYTAAAQIGKRRVTCSYMRHRLGYLMVEGDQQSIVKWDDNFPETCIINKYLEDVVDKPKKGKKKRGQHH